MAEEKNYGSRCNFAKRTKEELSEFGKKGGKKSGEVRRQKKEMKNILETFASMPLKKGKVYDIDEIKSFMDLKGKNVTTSEAMGIKLMQRALTGDLSAIQMVLTMLGEKPADKLEVKDVTPVIISGENELKD